MLSWLRKLLTQNEQPVGRAAAVATANRENANGGDSIAQAGHAMAIGDFVRAVGYYSRAVASMPDDAALRIALSFALCRLKRYVEARQHLNRAILLEPRNAGAYYLLGKVAQEQRELASAIDNFNETLEIQPDFEPVFDDLPQAYLDMGEVESAEHVLLKGIACHPTSARLLTVLGNLYANHRQPLKAIECYRSALSYDPERVDTHNNLGNTLHEQGDFESAINHLRHAVACEPDSIEILNNLLLVLSFDSRPSNKQWEYLTEAKSYGKKATARAHANANWMPGKLNLTTQRSAPPLRVGLVSGDFRNHPVGYFLENILHSIHSARIDLFAYSMNPVDDALTDRIRPIFMGWTSLVGISDEDAARQIRDDGIQILIDLAGHCVHNRLPLFAWKPAPVQASWLGYLASTGVSEIDYVLADPVSAPAAVSEQFVEKIWRLPETIFCFSSPAETPLLAISPLPALQNGFITFGSFQRVNKINDGVLALWGEIFKALPSARLCLRSALLDIDSVRAEMFQRLKNVGIAEDRIALEPGIPDRNTHLAAYSAIDIVLDTFPYPGATTTCEAMWMGVPTLTLFGETMLGRIGASLLTCAGLPEWVAQSEAEYVSLAIRSTTDVENLARLRAGLRARIRTTTLFDANRFAPQLEEALLAMWAEYMGQINAV